MKKLLFVCLGNICRSPTAEAIMNHLIQKEGLEDQITCDSAGTIGYHQGSPADSRMKKHAAHYGYDLTSISRPVSPEDFEKFDMIIGMDDQNVTDLHHMDYTGKNGHKIHKMTNFCNRYHENSVPDPYYGGDEGFKKVIHILEDACGSLLAKILHEK